MRAKRVAREFVDTYPDVEAGLLLVGPSGRGKTHLACAVLSELVSLKGVTGLYADFSDLLLKIQTSFRPDADSSKESILQPYAEAELLVLDELGASKPHPWVLDVLYNLLNTRYNRRRVTIVTSNFEDEPDAASGERDRLEDRVGSRIRSRLFEMCLLVPLRGDDFRRTVVQGRIQSRF
jgi:DNA replication protein DnaC